jgi:hypothetical protein
MRRILEASRIISSVLLTPYAPNPVLFLAMPVVRGVPNRSAGFGLCGCPADANVRKKVVVKLREAPSFTPKGIATTDEPDNSGKRQPFAETVGQRKRAHGDIQSSDTVMRCRGRIIDVEECARYLHTGNE